MEHSLIDIAAIPKQALDATHGGCLQMHWNKIDLSLLPNPQSYYETQFPTLRGSGKHRRVSCPFHNGKDRNLSLNLETGSFKCFVCGISGSDIIQFHREFYKLSFPEAIENLCGSQSIVSNSDKLSKPFSDDAQDNRARYWQNSLIKNSQPAIPGDLLHCYLIERRRIPLTAVPRILRLHPGLNYRDEDGGLIGKFPAMLAPVVNLSGEMVAVHRTWLSNDGFKAPVSAPKKLTKAIAPGATMGADHQVVSGKRGTCGCRRHRDRTSGPCGDRTGYMGNGLRRRYGTTRTAEHSARDHYLR